MLFVAALALALTARVWVLASYHERLVLAALAAALSACCVFAALSLTLSLWRELRRALRSRIVSSIPSPPPEEPRRPRGRWWRRFRREPRRWIENALTRAPDGTPYLTPYPFSVWSYHDNIPEFEVVPVRRSRGWLWWASALVLACVALAAMLWWGFSVAQVWAALG
jgi:hypothetical protein